MGKYRIYFCWTLLLLVNNKLSANIRLPAVIADNMVLQQRSTVAIWGWAEAGEEILVSNSWNHTIAKTVTDGIGNWKLFVTTGKAGGPYTLTIRGKNTVTVNNVLLGEVWLCSGQSNMAFPLAKQGSWRTGVFNYETEITSASYPEIRMFHVKETVADEPQKDVKGNWDICTPITAGSFSAVAYYFAKEIYQATGYPIGIIHSSWGGTPAESWTSKEVLTADAELNELVKQYTNALQDYPRLLTAYREETEQWKKDSVLSVQKGEKIKAVPSKPINPQTDSKSPAKLYNAMIHPLVPYTLKGVLWYQGESNSDRPHQYRKLFPALINQWRKEWGANLSFYFVQIAPHYQKIPEIREAQLLTFQSVANSGMAVITDFGDSLNIHPRNKEVVGQRLALWALAKNYGKKKIVFSGPVFRAMQVETGKLILQFDYADGGLVAKDGPLKEFTIAGSKGKFIPAQAIIKGHTIVVWNDTLSKPVAVRFAWKNFPRPNLYNKEGLPASPFRTDNWDEEPLDKK